MPSTIEPLNSNERLDLAQLESHERSQWNDFVGKHPFGSIYHLCEWQTALERTFSHIKGQVLVLKDPITKQIIAGLPVYTVKSWLLGKRIVSVPFASLCDPLVSSVAQMDRLLGALKEFREKISGRVVEIRTLNAGTLISNLAVAGSDAYRHHFIELPKNPDDLWPRFSRTAIRRMVHKAEKAGFTVAENPIGPDLSRFYHLLCLTRKRLGLPSLPYTFFGAIWQYLGPKRVCLLEAHLGEQSVAGVMAFRYKDMFILEYAGEALEARNSGASQLLYWEAIKLACRDGYRTFSFGRTSVLSRGLMEYKAHWGTQQASSPYFFLRNGENDRVQNADALSKQEWFRGLIRRSPMPMYRCLSRFCYQHWG